MLNVKNENKQKENEGNEGKWTLQISINFK